MLRKAKFTMVKEDGESASWRWRGGQPLSLTVEFFCPAGPDRPAGRLHRPRGVVGNRLSALALATGRLIDLDHRQVEVDVELPDAGGRTRHPMTVVGPAAYLASKADALQQRDKNKDAYDIVWLAEAWPGGQAGLASEIRQSRVADETEFRAALETLGREFADVDAAGAVKYARFVADQRHELDYAAQRAVGAVRALLTALGLRS